jgi:hypothetical protein
MSTPAVLDQTRELLAVAKLWAMETGFHPDIDDHFEDVCCVIRSMEDSECAP